jgi:hypothetical protein
MLPPFSEDREAKRFDHFSLPHVNDLKSGEIYEARMSNYSDRGIYFESDGFFQKGINIYISMQNSPYAQISGVLEFLYGQVMWRKSLKRSFLKYGYHFKSLMAGAFYNGILQAIKMCSRLSKKWEPRPIKLCFCQKIDSNIFDS